MQIRHSRPLIAKLAIIFTIIGTAIIILIARSGKTNPSGRMIKAGGTANDLDLSATAATSQTRTNPAAITITEVMTETEHPLGIPSALPSVADPYQSSSNDASRTTIPYCTEEQEGERIPILTGRRHIRIKNSAEETAIIEPSRGRSSLQETEVYFFNGDNFPSIGTILGSVPSGQILKALRTPGAEICIEKQVYPAQPKSFSDVFLPPCDETFKGKIYSTQAGSMIQEKVPGTVTEVKSYAGSYVTTEIRLQPDQPYYWVWEDGAPISDSDFGPSSIQVRSIGGSIKQQPILEDLCLVNGDSALREVELPSCSEKFKGPAVDVGNGVVVRGKELNTVTSSKVSFQFSNIQYSALLTQQDTTKKPAAVTVMTSGKTSLFPSDVRSFTNAPYPAEEELCVTRPEM